MKEIAQAVRIGARAYLKRQYLGDLDFLCGDVFYPFSPGF